MTVEGIVVDLQCKSCKSDNMGIGPITYSDPNIENMTVLPCPQVDVQPQAPQESSIGIFLVAGLVVGAIYLSSKKKK